jgi:hypothetical protein
MMRQEARRGGKPLTLGSWGDSKSIIVVGQNTIPEATATEVLLLGSLSLFFPWMEV